MIWWSDDLMIHSLYISLYRSRRRSDLKCLDLQIGQFSCPPFWVTGTPVYSRENLFELGGTPVKTCLKGTGTPVKTCSNFGGRNYFKSDLLRLWSLSLYVSKWKTTSKVWCCFPFPHWSLFIYALCRSLFLYSWFSFEVCFFGALLPTTQRKKGSIKMCIFQYAAGLFYWSLFAFILFGRSLLQGSFWALLGFCCCRYAALHFAAGHRNVFFVSYVYIFMYCFSDSFFWFPTCTYL